MDINECLVSNGGCDSRTRCYNTPGSSKLVVVRARLERLAFNPRLRAGSRVCGECPPGNYVGALPLWFLAPRPHHNFHVRGKGQVTATRAASMWTSAPQATKSATPGLTAPTSMAATPAPDALRASRGVVSRAARVWGHCPMALSFPLEVASFSPRCARAALCFFSWTPLR